MEQCVTVLLAHLTTLPTVTVLVAAKRVDLRLFPGCRSAPKSLASNRANLLISARRRKFCVAFAIDVVHR